MPRLIHLNGPSGIGKSTIAQAYADVVAVLEPGVGTRAPAGSGSL